MRSLGILIEASHYAMSVLDSLRGGMERTTLDPACTTPEIDRLVPAEGRVERELLWVNPDCGLKTHHWKEIMPVLEKMVAAVGAPLTRHHIGAPHPNVSTESVRSTAKATGWFG